MAHLLAADILRKGTCQARVHFISCRWASGSQCLSSLGAVSEPGTASAPHLLSGGHQTDDNVAAGQSLDARGGTVQGRYLPCTAQQPEGARGAAAASVISLAGGLGMRGVTCSPSCLGAELALGPWGCRSASTHALAARQRVRDLYWPHGSSACSPPQPHGQRRTPVMPLHLDFNQDVRIMEANSILQRMQVLQFREHLEDISEEQHTISHAQLIALCQESGAAATRAEAERICEALNMAGIVLRYRDVVYLRPSEVSDIIIEALPDTFSDISAKLQQLRNLLDPIEKHKMEVDRKARRFSTVMLRFGFVLLFVQWAIFVRLTFWDLGWDFMEPITYYTTTFVGLVAYAYYLNYRRSFDFQSMDDHLTSDLQEKGYAAKGIDMARYNRLQRDIDRYERYLDHLSERPGTVPPPRSDPRGSG